MIFHDGWFTFCDTLRLFKSTNNVLLTEGPIPLADHGLIEEVSVSAHYLVIFGRLDE